MTDPIKLDRTDRRILEVLQENGRIPNVELARQVALSPSPCLRRLQRLEEAGVIDRYAAILNPARLGLSLLAFVSVSLDKRSEHSTDDFKQAALERPEVSGMLCDDRRDGLSAESHGHRPSALLPLR